ncbi:MAG: hypothetical protein QGG36_30660 [Pirellulaceae bacterium]|jgi:hypothetical protein|nr:hypothetical protein [Pirellulaceae bacterium]MDP7020199.1 hypothetical protein [Pirellulaceae bacterium]
MTRPSPDDAAREELAWRATLYVLGELDKSELPPFEAQLAEDQLSRDAVAAAVNELSLAEAACAELAESPIASASSASSSPGWGWRETVARGTVALAVVFALFAGVYWYGAKSAGVAESSSDQDSNLAMAWGELVGEVSSENELPLESLASVETSDILIRELESPSWMLAALQADMTDMNERSDMEN